MDEFTLSLELANKFYKDHTILTNLNITFTVIGQQLWQSSAGQPHFGFEVMISDQADPIPTSSFNQGQELMLGSVENLDLEGRYLSELLTVENWKWLSLLFPKKKDETLNFILWVHVIW